MKLMCKFKEIFTFISTHFCNKLNFMYSIVLYYLLSGLGANTKAQQTHIDTSNGHKNVPLYLNCKLLKIAPNRIHVTRADGSDSYICSYIGVFVPHPQTKRKNIESWNLVVILPTTISKNFSHLTFILKFFILLFTCRNYKAYSHSYIVGKNCELWQFFMYL